MEKFNRDRTFLWLGLYISSLPGMGVLPRRQGNDTSLDGRSEGSMVKLLGHVNPFRDGSHGLVLSPDLLPVG